MTIFIVERCLYFPLKSNLLIIGISELILTLYSLKHFHPFSADHDALSGKYLNKRPLENCTDSDNIQNSDGIETTCAGSTSGNSKKETSNKKKHKD